MSKLERTERKKQQDDLGTDHGRWDPDTGELIGEFPKPPVEHRYKPGIIDKVRLGLRTKTGKTAVALTVVGTLVVGYNELNTSSEKTSGKSDKDTSASSNPFEQTNPQISEPVQEKPLQPTDEIIAKKYIPVLYGEDEYAGLPQPGTPEGEVEQFCKLRASAISSNRPDLLANLYQYNSEASLANDMNMLEGFNEAKSDMLAAYPNTPEPLFAFQCKNVRVDPNEQWVDGSHRVTFSNDGSIIDKTGAVYQTLFSSSYIGEDQSVTLKRDLFVITPDGKERQGILAVDTSLE